MAEFVEDWRAVLVVASLGIFWTWESVGFFLPQANRWRHAGRNLSLALFNAVVLSFGFAQLTLMVADWSEAAGSGLLRLSGLSGLPLLIASLIVLDIWMYWWHRFNHVVPFLWLFHRMHHSDASVDVTTATRFHVGEIIMSASLRLILIPLGGIPIEAVLVYDALQLPVICFHHANISLPPGLDRALRFVLVTPFMHKVHHSRVPEETDSNYSSVLSFWDRIFRSYTEKDDYRKIRFGLDGFDEESRQTVGGLLRTPMMPAERKES